MDDSKITLKELNAGLLSILECPICLDFMEPPIVQCRNGHSVCATCRTKLTTCSTCRANFAGTNLTMEKITEVVMYPCKYTPECEVEVLLKYKDIHEQDCDFRPFPCLFPECGWKRCRSKYSGHLDSAHINKLFVGSSQITEVVMYPCKYAPEGCEVEIRLKYKEIHIQDCAFRPFPCLISDCGWKRCSNEYYEHLDSAHNNKLLVGSSQVVPVQFPGGIREWLIYAFGRFFLVKFSIRGDVFCGAVFYEGILKQASKFYYTFRLSHQSEPHNSLEYTCTPYDVEMIHVNMATLDKCFTVPYKMGMRYKASTNGIQSIPVAISIHEIQ